jgi:DNA-binding NarL/FixJ family response regulator
MADNETDWATVPSAVQLTPEETDLVGRVVAGKTNREIAKELGLTEKAVKKALSIIYDKCQVRGRLGSRS